MARHLRRSYPTEHEEQAAFCRWLDAKGIGYFAVPNGARVRPAQAKKLKAEGMTAGAPDLVIYADAESVVPVYGRRPPVAVEMKRQTRGTVSPAQREMHAALRLSGWVVIVARGCKDAIRQIGAMR